MTVRTVVLTADQLWDGRQEGGSCDKPSKCERKNSCERQAIRGSFVEHFTGKSTGLILGEFKGLFMFR